MSTLSPAIWRRSRTSGGAAIQPTRMPGERILEKEPRWMTPSGLSEKSEGSGSFPGKPTKA